MAREPDNLVLTLLREMRSDMSAMREDIAGVKTRLDGIDKKMDEHHYLMTHTFGVAGMANIQTGLVDARVDELVTRQKASEAKQVELERRLARVEEKV
jgi:tetrahydromethanopterin S-methyltransferase subunit G